MFSVMLVLRQFFGKDNWLFRGRSEHSFGSHPSLLFGVINNSSYSGRPGVTAWRRFHPAGIGRTVLLGDCGVVA